MEELSSTFFKTGLEWLKAFFNDAFAWVRSVPVLVWALVGTFVFGPIGKVLDLIIENLDWVQEQVNSLITTLEGLKLDEWGGYWSQVGEAAGICNVYIPLDIAFAVLSTLIALWTVCMLIRLGFKVKAFFWAS